MARPSLDEIFGAESPPLDKAIDGKRPSLDAIFNTQAKPVEPKEQWNDGVSAAAMTAKGYLGGFGDEIYGGLAALGAKGVGELADLAGVPNRYEQMSVGDIYRQERDAARQSLKSIEQEDPGIAIAGQIVGAVANPVKFKGGMIARGGKDAAMFALGDSEADLTKGDVGGALQDTLTGAALGAGTGAVLGGASKVLKPAGDKAISATRKASRKAMEQIGINDLTPGQATGNRALNVLDGALDDMVTTSGAARKKQEGQLRKFTRAALQKAGIEADELTPEVREVAEAQFNRSYQDIFDGESVKLGENLRKAVRQIRRTEANKVSQNMTPAIKSYISDLSKARNMTGRDYQAMRSRMTKQIRSLTSSDPFAADVVRSLRDALDGAATLSIPAQKMQQLQKVNTQYSNYKLLTKAISTTTDDAIEGLLSPKKLLQSIETNNKTKSQAGYGELYDLSRSASNVLPNRVPSSGTSERQLGQRLLTAGAAGGGGLGAYAVTGDPELAAYTAGGLLVAPKIAQKALNAKAAQSYFTKGIPGLNRVPDGVGNVINRAAAQQIGSNVAGVGNESRTPAPIQQEAAPQSYTPSKPVELTRPEAKAGLFDKIKQAESSGDPNAKNPNSSASGLFQFTDQTWKDSVKKWGKKHGITEDMKNDPAAQETMVRELARDNARILVKSLKTEPSEGDMYVAHFMGAPQAVKLIKNKNSKMPAAKLFPREAKANKSIFYKSGKPRTMAEVYNVLARKVQDG